MTYSIVARCPDTGMFGVAVLTHNLAVGAVVPWVRAGVGAIATQSDTNPAYGYKGLQLLQKGLSPDEVIDEIGKHDNQKDERQVGIVDANGQSAAWTGTRCIAYASHITEPSASFQANLMRNDGVPEAMAASWAGTSGALLENRLLDALMAAQRAGGDLRGQQSAAIKIAGSRLGEPWDDIPLDVRVDDHPSPLEELKRLVNISIAYRLGNEAIAHSNKGELLLATETWQRAAEASPNNQEVAFWRGLYLANIGELDGARESFAKACAINSDLKELIVRLADSGALHVSASAVLED